MTLENRNVFKRCAPKARRLIEVQVSRAVTCTVGVNVTGVALGIQINRVTVSDAVQGTGNTSTATLASGFRPPSANRWIERYTSRWEHLPDLYDYEPHGHYQ